ncbi:MAG: helix-turn-helix transcriptional regulator [Nitrospinae bacterium]|nr:helix-turn-helix transcriptional regulator [Nitrospinota bacterium]
MRVTRKGQEKKIRELLRNIRETAGLRQVDLAMRLKRPQSYISKYESGEKILDLLEAREVCLAMGISFGDFVRRMEESFNES